MAGSSESRNGLSAKPTSQDAEGVVKSPTELTGLDGHGAEASRTTHGSKIEGTEGNKGPVLAISTTEEGPLPPVSNVKGYSWA